MPFAKLCTNASGKYSSATASTRRQHRKAVPARRIRYVMNHKSPKFVADCKYVFEERRVV